MVRIILNGTPTELPVEVKTIADLLKWRNIPSLGTAVAVNGKLVTASNHEFTNLNEMDGVTIISAAYGG